MRKQRTLANNPFHCCNEKHKILGINLPKKNLYIENMTMMKRIKDNTNR